MQKQISKRLYEIKSDVTSSEKKSDEDKPAVEDDPGIRPSLLLGSFSQSALLQNIFMLKIEAIVETIL
jgi:hypothetical protein